MMNLGRPTPFLLLTLLSVISTGCLNMDSTSVGGSVTAPQSAGGTIMPTPTNTPAANAAGVITTFDPTNKLIKGYAYDSNNPQISFAVELWVNGPLNVGTNLGQITANAQHNLFPQGPYAFNFSVPPAYQDGQMRQIYAYAITPGSGTRNALGNSPLAFWAGTNQAGMSYYNSTVAPAVQADCTACHAAPSYLSLKQLMAEPDRFSGGTAANNTLINTALGGNNHGGGNRCGSASGSPCAEFQSWWAIEF